MNERLEKIFAKTSDSELILYRQAAELIKEGELVAFPTETVYGLGANALNEDAVKKIFLAKGRPSDNPLILHVSSVAMAEELVQLNERAEILMDEFWPGPLSLILVSKDIVPLSTRGGLETAAIRMPDNRIALEIIRLSNLPIAAPSANKSGRPSPTDAKTVRDDLGEEVKLIIDGGKTEVGVESTVLDISGDIPIILRPGAISKEDIEKLLQTEVFYTEEEKHLRRSPGNRYRHYAPKIPLILSVAGEIPKETEGKNWAWIGLSEPLKDPKIKIIFKDIAEYAKELFAVLREIEESEVELIVAEMPQQNGIGAALADRLKRASES